MKVASIGFWHVHGRDYAAAAQHLEGLELVAGWDADVARGRAACQEFGIKFVEDLDAILRDETIRGVIVCSPTTGHTEIVSQCLRAGKHVFVEKVLSPDLAGANEIAQVASDAGVTLTVSMWRADRGYARQIAGILESGLIGRVTSARFRDGHHFALPADGRSVGILPDHFFDPTEAFGGALVDLCHPLYLAAFTLGVPSEVSASFSHIMGRAVEDNASVTMRYSSGAIATVETSLTTRFAPFSIEIHGTEGSLMFSEPGIGAMVNERFDSRSRAAQTADDLPRLRYRSTQLANEGWEDVPIEPDSPLAIERWEHHVKAGITDDSNVILARQLSALIEASYRSASEGRVVSVPLCD